jgi:flagellar basal body rod protein FlgB
MSIIKTDMAKAREIHKTNIRTARTPKLQELDIEFQKALETGASTTDIVAKKQALRDAPADSAIDAATDEAELKAQWNTSILGTSPYS